MNVGSAINGNDKNKSSKVVVVQPFNAACLACQRRKVRCIGNPCLYCCKKGYNCEFKASKKRGPTKKVKLPQEIHECSSVVSSIQESMNITLQHTNFVEHYFITVGKAIPMSVKESLLSSPNLNSEQITQVCIITANIMKAYGSKELELQYIKKAHETISIFSCDNINSAASLVMMANYLGGDNPKSMNLIQIAQSIANLPSMDSSQLTNEIKHICEILSVMFSTTLSRSQKANFLIQLSYQITPDIALNIPQEGLVVISSIICRHLLYSIARFDDHDLDTFLQSMSLEYIMSPIEREKILKEMARFEHCFELQPVKKPIAVVNFDFMRFTIEWRSGNIEGAFVIAKRVMDYMRNSMVAMTFLNESGSLRVLLLPYFFEENGYTELTLEIMQCYYNQFKQVGREDELRELWDKMRPSTGTINGHNIHLLPTIHISQYLLHNTVPNNNRSTLNPEYQLITQEFLPTIPQSSQQFISPSLIMPDQLSTLSPSTIMPEQQYISSSTIIPEQQYISSTIMPDQQYISSSTIPDQQYISSSIIPDQHFTNISQDIPFQDLDILHFNLDSYTNTFPF